MRQPAPSPVRPRLMLKKEAGGHQRKAMARYLLKKSALTGASKLLEIIRRRSAIIVVPSGPDHGLQTILQNKSPARARLLWCSGIVNRRSETSLRRNGVRVVCQLARDPLANSAALLSAVTSARSSGSGT